MSKAGAEMADMGLKAVMGLSSAYLADANANAANIVSEANAWASNLVRGANNQLAAARGSLARNVQSINNQRALDNMGSNVEAALVNYRRARDSATQDDFETQLQLAEQAGAQAAAGALSGLTGGVADIVAGTTALRKQRIQQRSAEAMKQGDWDASRRAKQIAQAGYDSLDHSEITDNIDQSIDVAVKQSSNSSALGAVLSGVTGKSMANALDWAKSKFSFSTQQDDIIPMQPGGGY